MKRSPPAGACPAPLTSLSGATDSTGVRLRPSGAGEDVHTATRGRRRAGRRTVRISRRRTKGHSVNAEPTPARLFEPPCGPVLSWQDGDVLRATGIPYATAGRFEPARPALDWDLPYHATSWAPACPQVPSDFLEKVCGASLARLTQDENCLNLSLILPPDVHPGDDLPVMVWIHGGSYTYFAGDVAMMDSAALVREQRVIVVSVTYRLGLFGYLGDGADRPANLGLLDQIEALRWVQRNIAAFGGDPGNVTAFGQSAGGDAIAHLMATDGVAGLFRRAIIQSAPLGIRRGRAAMTEAMLAEAAGITAQTPTQQVVDAQLEIAKAAAPFGLLAAMPFGTQYGYHPLPSEDEIEAAWDAHAPDVEVLIGYTAQEARLFIPRMPQLQRVARVPILGTLACRAIAAVVTKRAYARACDEFAERHAKAGGRAYRYVISWAAPGNEFGAAHTIDLPLLFGDESTWREAELVAGATWSEIEAQGRRVRGVWADFARGQLPPEGELAGVLRYHLVPPHEGVPPQE
ncbi:MAG: carboxylesterase/lipase family protein [Austwickia sp.]|nr:carboxylesterase/lipase family protein [Austwickia sp.]